MAKRLGELLRTNGVISDAALAEALATARQRGERLGDVLVRLGYATDREIAEVLQQQLGMPWVSLTEMVPEPSALALVPEALIRRAEVLPLHLAGNELVLGMVDPLDYYALEDVRMTAKRPIRPTILVRSEFQAFVDRYFGFQQTGPETPTIRAARSLNSEGLGGEGDDTSPIARLLMDVVSQAVRAQASDVHLDPEADAVRIRFRVDGLLHEEQRLPRALFGRLLSRIKILSDLDITEHRLPQDGRIRMEVDGHPVDLRVAILPVMRGEKVVLRVLDARHQLAGLSTLRLSAENAARIHRALDRPGGLMLAVGPTGSGKTTTLYAVLQQVASETVNTVTIEDPVEYEIAGLSQVAVNVATGLTFATGLRAILRQDPDVVMVGEIRDEETAEIATRAALTGHFVLSTLHTLGALETVDRLKEMGVPPYLLAAALRLVVSQRLVRRVCSVCAESVALSAVEQAWAERVYTAEVASAGRLGDNIAWPFPSHEPVRTAFGRGCAACRGLGLKGRLALHEVVYWDEALRTAVVAGEPEAALRQRAREAGSTSLAYDGLCKVALGETTVAEVMRAVGGVVP